MTGKGASALRHAEEADKQALLDYLRPEPEFNLFIVGDILNFGLRSPIVDVFIQEGSDGCEAALLRYRWSLLLYTRDPSLDLAPSVQEMNAYLRKGGDWVVSGKKPVMDAVQPRLAIAPTRQHDHYFCVCRRLSGDPPPRRTNEAGALPAARPLERRVGRLLHRRRFRWRPLGVRHGGTTACSLVLAKAVSERLQVVATGGE